MGHCVVHHVVQEGQRSSTGRSLGNHHTCTCYPAVSLQWHACTMMDVGGPYVVESLENCCTCVVVVQPVIDTGQLSASVTVML